MNNIRIRAAAVAVGSLLALAACAPIEGRETAGNYVDDSSITTQVKAQLVQDQALKAFDIHVTTEKDVVQLSGFVGTEAARADAERIARNTKGVVAVQNALVVR